MIIVVPTQVGNIIKTQRNYARTAKQSTIELFWIRGNPKIAFLTITFNSDYEQEIICSNCDALAVRAVVARNDLNRMLVDNGISMNILFGNVFDQMQVDHTWYPWLNLKKI